MTSRFRAVLALRPPVMPLADAARLAGPTVVILAGLALAEHYLLGLLIALGTYRRCSAGSPIAVTGWRS